MDPIHQEFTYLGRIGINIEVSHDHVDEGYNQARHGNGDRVEEVFADFLQVEVNNHQVRVGSRIVTLERLGSPRVIVEQGVVVGVAGPERGVIVEIPAEVVFNRFGDISVERHEILANHIRGVTTALLS